jgi:autotransporter adhesin
MKNNRTRDRASCLALLPMSLCIAALGWLPVETGAQNVPASYFDANGLKDGSDNAKASGVDAVAAGNASVASGAQATALGSGSLASDQDTTAVGAYAAAVKANASAVGANSFAGETGSTALGANANALGVNATVVGESALVNGKNSTALGRLSRASTDNSVALGASSVAERANTVSVGSVQSVTDSDGNITAPFQRQIVNVAAGTQDNDVTNLAQYRNLVTALGGNASLNAAGALVAPSYVIQGASSAKVGDAFSAVDIWLTGMRSSLTSLDTRVVGIDTRATKLEQTVAATTTTTNSASTLSADLSATTQTANNSAQYGNGGTALVLNANNGAGTVINNVAAGTAATDAANVGQLSEMQKALVTLFNSGACKIGASGSVACGNGVSAKGANAIAQGTNASANGDNTVALGAGATASFNGSVAIGAGAQAIADPATAIGNNAIASGNNSVAVGANAVASASNSVALGQGSIATRANTVSVGYAGSERQIANVAPGTAGTDAVNLNQMQASAQDTLNQSKSYAARATAQAMAIPRVYIAPGDNSGIALGTASYGGYGALGIAFASSLSQHSQLAIGASTANGGQMAIQGSGSYSW